MPDRMFTVPAGTSPSRCNGSTCQHNIYWVTEPNGRRVPVDCSGPDCQAPSGTNDPSQLDAFAAAVAVHDGVGIHHQSVCANADEFARAKTGAR